MATGHRCCIVGMTPEMQPASTGARQGGQMNVLRVNKAASSRQNILIDGSGEGGSFAEDGIPTGIWAMAAPVLWSRGITGKGVKVAVLDSGIDSGHPALKDKVIVARDYINDGVPMSDWFWHGTHVAGTIAAGSAVGPDDQLKGTAPDVKLMDYRVLGQDGSGSDEAIGRAMQDAIRDGAHVINLSIGSAPRMPPAFEQALAQAKAKGIVVVAAAGNEAREGDKWKISYPAYYPETIAVGAVDFWGNDGTVHHASFSNSNDRLDCAADGFEQVSCVPSSDPAGKYGVYSGTSMAAPAVAGFAALLLQRHRDRFGSLPDADMLRMELKGHTVDIPQLGVSAVGAGFLTAYPALPSRSSKGHWIIPGMEKGADTFDGTRPEPGDGSGSGGAGGVRCC